MDLCGSREARGRCLDLLVRVLFDHHASRPHLPDRCRALRQHVAGGTLILRHVRVIRHGLVSPSGLELDLSALVRNGAELREAGGCHVRILLIEAKGWIQFRLGAACGRRQAGALSGGKIIVLLLLLVVDPRFAVSAVHGLGLHGAAPHTSLLVLFENFPFGSQVVDVRADTGRPVECARRHQFIRSHGDGGVIVVESGVLILREALFLQF